MKISVHSNVGKQRKANQDYADYYVSPHNQIIFILCDGVGGHQAGEVASELTTKYIGQSFIKLQAPLDKNTVNQWINQVIHEVNDYIYNKSIENSSLEGMGTTLIMALFVEEQIFIAHVGDSRAYVFQNSQLKQLTEDHSLINELIRSGKITEEEGNLHPSRNIVTQSIGVTESVAFEQKTIDIQGIETLMLCSDGLTNMLSFQEMGHYFNEDNNIDSLGKELVVAANNAGGKDNITIILVSHFSKSQESEAM